MTGALTLPDPATGFPAAPAPDAEAQGPYPARFWWFKRLTLLCLALAVGVAALRVWWGREAERRLQAALAPLVAEGWPVRAADMNPPPVPEEVNAAAYLKAAIKAIDAANDSPAASSLTYPSYPPYGAEWEALAEASVAGSAKAFPLARRARAFDRFDWGTRVKRPAVATPLPHLNDARHMANTVGDAALHAHVNGDDAAALEAVRDVLHLDRGVGAEPFLVTHLVRVGIESLALSRLQVIAPGMAVAPDGADGGATTTPADGAPAALPAPKAATQRRAAGRAQVRALVAELLDERDLAASQLRAYASERAGQVDTAEWMGELAPMTRPMFRLDAVRMIERNAALMEAAAQPSSPAANAVLARAAGAGPPAPPTGANLFNPPRVGRVKRERIDYPVLLSSKLANIGMGRAIEHHMRVRAERRMTAVSLAAQLYRADTGRWPPSIEALVPKYLPEVPVDPLAADGRPLKYLLVRGGLPDGGDRPVVYSVGRNGVDDTPDAKALPGSPWTSWNNGRDEYRELARWVVPQAATQPTTAPSNGGGP
jgi:hypothetical protein